MKGRRDAIREGNILTKHLIQALGGHLGRPANILLGTVVAAALFWGVFWAQTADSPLTRAPMLDEAWYLTDAAAIRDEGWPGGRPFVMSPGYTWLVAAAGARAPGEDGVLTQQPAVLIVLQAILWLGCGLLPAWAVWRLGAVAGCSMLRRRAASILAGLLMLLYAPAAVFARSVLLDLPLTCLVAAAVTLAVVSPRRAWWAALILGLAGLLRAHVVVLALLVIPLAWRSLPRTPWRSLRMVVLLMLILGPLALTAVHNSRLAGRLVGPSLNAGVNLYLGQQAAGGGLFTTLAGFDQARDPAGVAFLSERLQHPVDGPAAADAAWRQEAWRVVREAPGTAVMGWLRKIWLHLQARELSQVTPLGRWASEAPVLNLLVVPWWVLAAAGIVGLGMAGAAASPWRGAALAVALAVLLLVMTQSVFFVVSRYRLVLAPLLALLAGLGVLTFRAGWRPVVWLVVAGLLVVPWGLSSTAGLWRGLEAQHLARRVLAVAGHDDDLMMRQRADELLAETCVASPRRWQPWYEHARNLALQGRHDEALKVLAQGATRADEPRRLEQLRIGVVREMGRSDQAEALIMAYLDEWPGDLDMLNDLMVLQGQRGRWRAVETTARQLLGMEPRDARGWLGLAAAQARLGLVDEARSSLQAGLERVVDPDGRALLQANLERMSQGSAPR